VEARELRKVWCSPALAPKRELPCHSAPSRRVSLLAHSHTLRILKKSWERARINLRLTVVQGAVRDAKHLIRWQVGGQL
jgi:hypothetical protein